MCVLKIIIMKTINLCEFFKNETKYRVILTVLCSGLFFSSCDNKKQNPYIAIKNGDGIEINVDTVSVFINSVHQTLFDVVYERGTVQYLRQIDGGTIEQLSGEQDDLQFLAHGRNEFTNQFEKAVITTRFDDTVLHVGSVVKISVRVGTDMMKSVFYTVVE